MKAEEVAAVVIVEGPPSGTTAAEWVAKARQESGFDPATEGPKSTYRHIGLWQIEETHGKAVLGTEPKSRDAFIEWLKDPKNNFKAAKVLYKNSGWKPWNPSGGKPVPTAADKKAVTDATSVITNIGAGNALGDAADTVSDVVGGVADAITSVPEALGKLVGFLQSAYEWMSDRQNIGRIVMVGIGGIVTIGALVTLAKPAISSTTSTVAGKVT